ncbi:MAG TPA: cation:proton antiporter, partial [Ilumatobacteraceae bacterium]|nr:cation:proton antiporter [Ilumatobacteraceae bacterium]
MVFGPLALILAAGLLGPLFASAPRFAPPIVVGQIFAGVAIGNGGLRWVDPSDQWLTGLAAVGFALLMFVVGSHLPLRESHLLASLAAGTGATVSVIVVALAVGFALAETVGPSRPGIFAVLLTTSSGAVALPVLQALGTQNRQILVATAWIAIADVLSVLAVPAVLATGGLGRVLVGYVAVIALGAGLYFVADSMRNHAAVRRVRSLSASRGWGLDLRISLVALFACAWLATRFGTSVLVAGFTIGVVVAALGEPRRVAQQLVGLGEGFLIPLFFVHLGAQLDLGALFRSPAAMQLAAALAFAGIALHVAVALVWKLPVALGLIASAQLGVPAAIVSIGLSTNQLTAAE